MRGITYDNDAKLKYRQSVYSFLRHGSYSTVAMQHSEVLLLDTWQALETIHALREGIDADSIYVVNRAVRRGSEAAFKACFTRSLRQAGLPKVTHVYPRADILAVAEQKRRTTGTGFDLINYDGCGRVGTLAFMRYVASLARNTNPNGVFAITVLGGRETKAVSDFISTVATHSNVNPDIEYRPGRLHSTRLRVIMSALDAAGDMRRSFRENDNNYIYVSSKSPMLHYATRMNRYSACDYISILSEALRAMETSTRRDVIDDAEFIDLCEWLHQKWCREMQQFVEVMDRTSAAGRA